MDDFVADMIFIDAPADRVFAALRHPEEMLVWWDADEAVIGAWENGEFEVKTSDGSLVTAVVESVTSGEEMSLREFYWERGGTKHGPSRVHFRLEERDGGVWFSVRHEQLRGAKDWEAFALAMRERWVAATVALKRHVEGI